MREREEKEIGCLDITVIAIVVIAIFGIFIYTWVVQNL